jgi:S1-C subfamily serine protease
VLVVSIEDDGLAALAGIEAGDVLVSIDGERLTDPVALVAATRTARAAGRAGVVVEVARGRARVQTVIDLR